MTKPAPGDRSVDSFIKDVALLLGIPMVGMLVIGTIVIFVWKPWHVETYRVPSGTSAPALAAGIWDWDEAKDRCVENPHLIEFSSDTTLMVLTHKEPWTDSTGAEHRVAEYDIQEIGPDRIRGQIRGETRMTSTGEPVVWELVFISSGTYRWRRIDLGVFGFIAGSVSRCPEATDTTVFR